MDGSCNRITRVSTNQNLETHRVRCIDWAPYRVALSSVPSFIWYKMSCTQTILVIMVFRDCAIQNTVPGLRVLEKSFKVIENIRITISKDHNK